MDSDADGGGRYLSIAETGVGSDTDEFVVLTAVVVDDGLTLFRLCGGDGMRRDGAMVDVNAMLLLDALPSLSSFI